MRMLIPMVLAITSTVYGNDELKQLQAEYSGAVLQLKAAEANLQLHEAQYKRLANLFKAGAVGADKVAKAKAEFQLAKLAVEQRQAQVEQANPALEKAKVNRGTIPLLKQKEAVLRELVELTTKAYRQGEGSITNVLDAQRKLLDVRLELAQTKEERIALLKEQVDIAKSAWEVVEARFKAATVPKADVLAAQAAYLDARIRLAREEPKDGWGSLKGRIVFDGEPPEPKPLVVTTDKDYLGKFKIVDESLVVGEDNGLANVLVYLRVKPAHVHQSYAETDRSEVLFQSVKGRFEPHVLTVQTGQTLLINNPGPLTNSFIFKSLVAPFNNVIRSKGTLRRTIKSAERLPVQMASAIHPWKRAHVLVLDHPYAAISSKDGTFEIKHLPVGDLQFQLWHERSGWLSVKPADDRGRFKVTIKPGTTDLGTIKVPASVLKK